MTSPEIPENLSYTADHEWIAIEPGAAPPAGEVRVGLSAVATEALGEIVFVELPALGATLTAGQACGEVESTKSVSEIVSPASGTVVAVNESLTDNPALVNQDPYGAGWLFAVEVTALGTVLAAADYRAADEG